MRDDSSRFFLVSGIHEGEEIANGDRLYARIAQSARGAAYRIAVERHKNIAAVVRPFRDFACQTLWRDGHWLGIKIIEQIAVARLPLHFLNGAKSIGDEQTDLRA